MATTFPPKLIVYSDGWQYNYDVEQAAGKPYVATFEIHDVYKHLLILVSETGLMVAFELQGIRRTSKRQYTDHIFKNNIKFALACNSFDTIVLEHPNKTCRYCVMDILKRHHEGQGYYGPLVLFTKDIINARVEKKD